MRGPIFLPQVSISGPSAMSKEAVSYPANCLSPCVRGYGLHYCGPWTLSFRTLLFLAPCLSNERKLLNRPGNWYIPNTATTASSSPVCCCCFSNTDFTECPSEDKQQHCVPRVPRVYALLTMAFPSMSLSRWQHYHGPTHSSKGGNISIVFALIPQASSATV